MTKFKKLLKKQSLVKAVLNGGHKELDDATVPFSLGLHESIAEKQPTHVLVIDISHDDYLNEKDDIYSLNYALGCKGERRIYDLNKVDFIQFHRPGKHNLIFVLLKDIDRKQRKEILQKSSLRTLYDGRINFYEIEESSVADNMVGYCEELVEIPEHFFAMVPKTGLRKGWWSWVNRWFLTDPVDECEFRKRMTVALTIQPIVWTLMFLARLVVSTGIAIIMTIAHVIFFLGGQQSRFTAKHIGIMYWKFTILNPEMTWREVFSVRFWSDDYFEFKIYAIGKRRIAVPISPLGLIIQVFLWKEYFSSVWMFFHTTSVNNPDVGPISNLLLALFVLTGTIMHLSFIIKTMPYQKVKEWCEKRLGMRDSEIGAKVRKIIRIGWAVTVACFVITQTPWTIVANSTLIWLELIWPIICVSVLVPLFIYFRKKIISTARRSYAFIENSEVGKWLKQVLDYLFVPKAIIVIPHGGAVTVDVPQKKFAKQTKVEWLKENMNIRQLPKKVDLNNIVAPTKTEEFVQKFKVSFWSAKSKVCKPYVKQ